MKKMLNLNFPLWLLFFVISLFIFVTSMISDSFNKSLSYYLSNIVVNLGEVGRESFQNVFYESIKNKSYIKDVKKENLSLREKIEFLENQLLKYKQEKEIYNQFVNQKDRISVFNIGDTIIANVIHSANFFNNKYISINVGKEDGIIDNMAVLSSEGVVGQIVKVDENDSVVMLITDPKSRIPAFTEKTNENGVVIANEENEDLKFVPYNEYSTPIDGEYIFTSGFDGIFPRNIPIAKLVKKDDSFVAIPVVDINKIFYVNVIMNKNLKLLNSENKKIHDKINIKNRN
jgi:rod shape-determining protein MreC